MMTSEGGTGVASSLRNIWPSSLRVLKRSCLSYFHLLLMSLRAASSGLALHSTNEVMPAVLNDTMVRWPGSVGEGFLAWRMGSSRVASR